MYKEPTAVAQNIIIKLLANVNKIIIKNIIKVGTHSMYNSDNTPYWRTK